MRHIMHLSHGVSSSFCSTSPTNSAYSSTLPRAPHAVPCMRGSLHLRVPRPNPGGGVPGASTAQPHEEDKPRQHLCYVYASLSRLDFRGLLGACPRNNPSGLSTH